MVWRSRFTEQLRPDPRDEWKREAFVKFMVWRSRFTEQLRPDPRTAECSPSPIPHCHGTKGLFTAVPFTSYIMSSCQKKKKKITRHTKRQNPTIWRDIANIRTRHGRDVGIVRPEIKTSIINMLRAQMDKRTSMQNQVGNVNREIEVLRKNQKEM